MQYNTKQVQAMYFEDGPCCVIAGAGSGKTMVLVERITFLMGKGVPHHRILAVTFSKKAAAEIGDRLTRLRGQHRVRVCTFHQLGYRILKNEPNGFVNGKDPIKEYQKIEFLQNATRGTILEEWGVSAKEVAGWISAMKSQLLHYTQRPKEAMQAGNDIAASYDIYEKYERYKEANRLYDFDDMTDMPVYRMRQNPELARKIAGLYDYILVDEYQDTGTSQRIMLQMIAPKGSNIFAVGDDYQSIYGFRGADIQNILGFKKHFPRAKIIRLDTNYRSTPEIVLASNALIHHNRTQVQKHVVSGKCKSGNRPTFTTYATAEQEAHGIARRIKQLVNAGAAFNDMAVLYRTNNQSRHLEAALSTEKLPFRIYEGKSFFEQRYICDIVDYLRLAMDPCRVDALLRILNKPVRYLGREYPTELEQFMKSQSVSIVGAMTGLSLTEKWKGKQQGSSLLHDILRMNQNHNQPPVQLLSYILDEIGYRQYMVQDSSDMVLEERQEAIRELFNLAEQYVSTTELMGYVETQISAYQMYKDDPNTVTLSTVHKSKGLEYPCVFIANCIDGLYPLDQNEDVEEERRLMYVAMTRAMNRLEISACEQYRDQMAAPSRFIGEIADYIDIVNLPGRCKTLKQVYSIKEDSTNADKRRDHI